MPISETDLPGVGKKHVIDLEDGSQLLIVTHNTGKREVFRRPDADADSEKLFELSDDLARTVGSIIEGSQFQPIERGTAQTTLPGGILMEWYEVEEGAPLAGETLEGAAVGAETGVTIVAIQRGDETIESPAPSTRIEAGDVLVAVGTRENCEALETMLDPDAGD